MNGKLTTVLAILAICGCTAQDGTQGARGSQGAAGEQGATGQPGEPGENPTITPLEVGDVNCRFGGTAVSVGESLSYVCNGATETEPASEDVPFAIRITGTSADFESFDSIGYGVEIDATGGPGASIYGDITLKRGFGAALDLMIGIDESTALTPLDALIVINEATSEPIIEFSATRGSLTNLEIEADADGARVANATLRVESLALATPPSAEREGPGSIRISNSAGVWGTFDSITLPSQARRTYEPLIIKKRIDKASPAWADVAEVMQNGPTPTQLTVEVLDSAGSPESAFVLENAWPSAIKARQGDGGLVEELHIMVSSFSKTF